ncbi:hypothetical protein T07_1988 [Trichinella nelsoni]|uniref:Uncharacterized protein n=1 Tax=Trichinella nelsoni TaxID=6336 RepID=A0A0V0S2F9_9BILA|nr:hypothetical protein T07_1988 [Trichinella nelsoni]
MYFSKRQKSFEWLRFDNDFYYNNYVRNESRNHNENLLQFTIAHNLICLFNYLAIDATCNIIENCTNPIRIRLIIIALIS